MPPHPKPSNSADQTGGLASRILLEDLDPFRSSSITEAHRIENRMPTLVKEADRRRSILENSPSRILIAKNPDADGGTPFLAQHTVGFQAIQKFDSMIVDEAARVGIDPNLVRAVMYVETSQGYYFGVGPLGDLAREAKAPDPIPKSKTVLPMNVNPSLWGALAGANSKLSDPRTNIRAGTVLLKRISERLPDPSPEAIATLYNSLSKDRVTDYGARVAQVYRQRPWQITPWAYARKR